MSIKPAANIGLANKSLLPDIDFVWKRLLQNKTVSIPPESELNVEIINIVKAAIFRFLNSFEKAIAFIA